MKPERESFAQTDSETHLLWAKMGRKNPTASCILHALIGLADKHNSVVVSHSALARMVDASERSVRRSIQYLEQGNWIGVVRIGRTNMVSHYTLNARVCWKAARDQRGFAAVTARVILDAEEQPNKQELGHQRPLRQIDTESIRAMSPDFGALPDLQGDDGLEGGQIDLEEYIAMKEHQEGR